MDPAEVGDSWSDELSKADGEKAGRYFGAVEHLKDHLDFINLRVGEKDNVIPLSREKRGRALTFEVPRASLMTAIECEIFDDLMVGNFMKTTLHGEWKGTDLAPYFVPWLTKYADNGRAKTKEEVREYLRAYSRRSYDFVLHDFEVRSKKFLRTLVKNQSPVYRASKKVYSGVKRVSEPFRPIFSKFF